MKTSTEVCQRLPSCMPELQSATRGTGIPAGNAVLRWADWIWALFFQVVVEEAGSVHCGDKWGNFPIGF